jgi:hypothetical protein
MPVLPINLDDPFIVSASVWSLLALFEGLISPAYAVPHTGTQERSASSPHVSNPYSPPHQTFSGSFFPIRPLDFPVDLSAFVRFLFCSSGLAVSDALQLHQASRGLHATYPTPSTAQYSPRSHHCVPCD